MEGNSVMYGTEEKDDTRPNVIEADKPDTLL